MKPDDDHHCMDCGVDTSEIHEYYMIHNELWDKINPDVIGLLCIGCVEKRLGRKLKPDDFPVYEINSYHTLTQSNRLKSRILGKRIKPLNLKNKSFAWFCWKARVCPVFTTADINPNDPYKPGMWDWGLYSK